MVLHIYAVTDHTGRENFKGGFSTVNLFQMRLNGNMIKFLSIIPIVMLTACSGFKVIPNYEYAQLCNAVNIAQDEAQLAPAWHENAGYMLERCGIPGAKVKGQYKACIMDAMNGYREKIECDVLLGETE